MLVLLLLLFLRFFSVLLFLVGYDQSGRGGAEPDTKGAAEEPGAAVYGRDRQVSAPLHERAGSVLLRVAVAGTSVHAEGTRGAAQYVHAARCQK